MVSLWVAVAVAIMVYSCEKENNIPQKAGKEKQKGAAAHY